MIGVQLLAICAGRMWLVRYRLAHHSTKSSISFRSVRRVATRMETGSRILMITVPAYTTQIKEIPLATGLATRAASSPWVMRLETERSIAKIFALCKDTLASATVTYA